MTKQKTSTVWAFCTVTDKVNRIAQCNLCNSLLGFKSTTTNLRKHLIRKHKSMLLQTGDKGTVTVDQALDGYLEEVHTSPEVKRKKSSGNNETQDSEDEKCIPIDCLETIAEQTVAEEVLDHSYSVQNKPPPQKPPPPPQMKQKTAIRLPKIVSTTSLTAKNDEQIFGDFVASTLRGIPTQYLRERLKFKIQKAILEELEMQYSS